MIGLDISRTCDFRPQARGANEYFNPVVIEVSSQSLRGMNIHFGLGVEVVNLQKFT